MQVFVHFFLQNFAFFLISLNSPVISAPFFSVLCKFLTFPQENLQMSEIFRTFAAENDKMVND